MGLLNLIRRNTGPAPDPNPGEGGYTAPRGPMGETGYPGSTGQVRTDPAAAGGKLRDAHQRFTGYGVEPNTQNRSALVEGSYAPAGSPTPRTRRGTADRAWVPPEGQQAELQQEATEWFGGPNRHIGTSELGPDHGPGSARWTERQQTLGFGGTRGLSAGIPGDNSAKPHARQFFAGKAAAPDGENRYVFGGVNGGQTSYTFDARMPLTSRGPGARGADLNADRYYAPTSDNYFGDQGGQFGYARQAPDGMHRPTTYYEPGPWTANFYDTTAADGGPDESGTAKQAIDATYFSPTVAGRRRA